MTKTLAIKAHGLAATLYPTESMLREEKTNRPDPKNFLRRAADLYFDPNTIERRGNGRIYELLGIEYAKKVIMGTVGRLAKVTIKAVGAEEQTNNYFIGNKPTLKALQKFSLYSKLNEIVHAVQVPISGSFLVSSLQTHDPKHMLSQVATQGFFMAINFYCAALQRYNRLRLDRAISKMKERTSKN